MIIIKSDEEIELLRESNLLVSKTLAEVAKNLAPGVTTLSLDKIAEEFILQNNAIPGFKNYHGYPYTLCISVNNHVVHGMPSNYVIKEGDIVSVDCGVYKNGFHGDSAFTFGVGEITEEAKHLLQITRESLYKGIEFAVEGFRVGDIGYAVQAHAEANKYTVVRELVGHGIGRDLHEKPEVPNYGKRGRGVKLVSGMVIAIEPMINQGAKDVKYSQDGWTISTKDGKLSAHFEHSVAIRKGKAEILSDFTIIDKVIQK